MATLVCVPVALADKPPTGDSAPSARAAKCGGLAPTLKGSRGDDAGDEKLTGTGKRDVISAGRGNDLAVGRGDDDVLCGGPGKDVLKGGAGDDLCIGGPGRDKLRGCEPLTGAPPVTQPPAPPPPTDPEPPDPGDPPTAVADSATVAEDAPPAAINVLANDTDADGGPKTITAKTDGANGTVAITGGGTGLTYAPNANYCNAPPGTTLDTFTYTLNGGSTATVSVTVTCVDDAPVAVNNSATVGEDSGPNAINVLANDTDVDGGAKTITAKTNGANGTVAITGGGTGLTYQPNANYCNAPPGTTLDTFTYTLNGGSMATVSVTVTCANDAPIVNTGAGSPSYTENGIAVTVAPNLTVTDSDSANLNGATAAITVGSAAGDRLNWTDTSANINATGSGTATISFTGTATVAEYQTALRAVSFDSTSNNPGNAPRTVAFAVADSGGAASGAATKGVSVTPVNDLPVVSGAGVLEHGENEAAEALAPGLTVTDVDSPVTSATVTITNAQTGDQLTWNDTFPSISGAGMGTGTVTLTGSSGSVSPTDMRDALRAVRYHTIDDTPDTTQRQVTFRVTDSGGAESAVNAGSTVLVNLTAQNDVPIVNGAPASAVPWTLAGAGVTLAPNLIVVDGDSDIASATVTNTTPQTGDCLAWADPTPAGTPPNVSSVACADILTLTGTASPAAYQAALRQVTFDSTGASTADRTIRFRVTDADGGVSALHPGNAVTVDVIS